MTNNGTHNPGHGRPETLTEPKPALATLRSGRGPSHGVDRTPDSRDVRLPADRFLWAVLDAPTGSRRAGRASATRAMPLAPGLLPLLAEQLHLDPDTLAAVGTPLDGGRVLVCAIEQDTLDPHRITALSLTPEAIPMCIAEGSEERPSPVCFDLLVGPFLPLASRRRQRLRHLIAAGALVVFGMLAALGLSRRAAGWDRAANDSGSRAALIASTIDPRATPLDLIALADEAQRRAESVRGLGTPVPVAPVLATVLADWPALAPPASLAVDDRSILATVLVPGDPGVFLAALHAPPGWHAQEPRLSTLDDATQIIIMHERIATPGGRIGP